MKFNRDEELAMNLLDYLRNSGNYQKAKALAEILQTTEIYLLGIILKLKKASLVETQHGNQGGVRRANRRISALEVVAALNRTPKPLSGRSSKVLTNVLNFLSKEIL